MDKDDLKRLKLIRLKDEIDALDVPTLRRFLFEFVKEPCAYAIGRFSDGGFLEDLNSAAKAYASGKIEKSVLLSEIDVFLQKIVTIEDEYDRKVLHSIASAYLALTDRAHAFDAIRHDLDAIVIDVGVEESLAIIPLRIDHHIETINKVRQNNEKLVWLKTS